MARKTQKTASLGSFFSRFQGMSRKKIIIFAIEILIILIMLAVLFFVLTKGNSGPKIAELDTSDLGISEEVLETKAQQQGETVEKVQLETGKIAAKGYVNIALFGVDATKESQLYKGSNSDSIMIANINMDTGDIKLVSVYRDSYLNVGTDTYRKCNYAYAKGGAEQAIKMLNMNLDMDITNFITVNYQSLIDLIDGLGGVYLDVDDSELKHINNYQATIVKDLKLKEYVPVKKTGYQLLNGLQATAYCRIRYKAGDDFARAASQREVIKAIEEVAKKTDIGTLTTVFDKVSQEIYTSLDSKDLMQLVTNINSYRITAEDGFPQEDKRTVANIGAKGSCVIPLDLESNVVWLHEFLYGKSDYTPSSTVKECSKKVQSDTAQYVKK